MRLLGPGSKLVGTDATVLDFWQWAYSDLLSNTNRSVLGEYIVGLALGVVERPRVEWDAVDLHWNGLAIEVKTSAYLQSWHQERLSKILFSVRKTVAWNPQTGKYEGAPTRSADVYVFCVYPEKERDRINVLDIPSWDFYVVPTKVIDQQLGDAKSAALSVLEPMATPCKVDGLKDAIARSVESCSTTR